MFKVKLDLGMDKMEFLAQTEEEALYLYKVLNNTPAVHWDEKITEKTVAIEYEPDQKKLELVGFLNWFKLEQEETNEAL